MPFIYYYSQSYTRVSCSIFFSSLFISQLIEKFSSANCVQKRRKIFVYVSTKLVCSELLLLYRFHNDKFRFNHHRTIRHNNKPPVTVHYRGIVEAAKKMCETLNPIFREVIHMLANRRRRAHIFLGNWVPFQRNERWFIFFFLSFECKIRLTDFFSNFFFFDWESKSLLFLIIILCVFFIIDFF